MTRTGHSHVPGVSDGALVLPAVRLDDDTHSGRMALQPVRRMTRRVRLVTGPPCAGKSTWAKQHAEHDTIVLDFDDYARAAGSTSRWNHAQRHRDAAEAAMLDAIADVAEADDGDWIVIRCAAEPEQRAELVEWLQAELIVLCPPYPVLMRRAAQRTGPRASRGIDHWLALNPEYDRG